MNIEDNALKVENPNIIKFDNIFSNDLAREQQFDLVFGTDEDDNILKLVDEYYFYDNYGNERVFKEIDDLLLNEDNEMVDDDDEDESKENNKDKEENNIANPEDIYSNDDVDTTTDTDNNPSIIVSIDADNVNINADDNIQEDGDITVNANNVSITPTNTGGETSKELMNKLSPTAQDVNDNQEPINGSTQFIDDNEDDVENTDDTDVPTDESYLFEEEDNDVDDNEIIDNSTEMVFSTNDDIEEKSDIYGESTSYLFEEEDNDVDDNEEDVENTDDTDVPTDESCLFEEEDIDVDDNEDIITGDPTLGEAPDYNIGIDPVEEPKHKDTSNTCIGLDSDSDVEIDGAMGTIDDIYDTISTSNDDNMIREEAEDPNEEYSENDAITSLLGIEPSITDGDLASMFNNADDMNTDDIVSIDDINEDFSGEYSDRIEDVDDVQSFNDIDMHLSDNMDDIANSIEDEDNNISTDEGIDTRDDNDRFINAISYGKIMSNDDLDTSDNDTDYGDNFDSGDIDNSNVDTTTMSKDDLNFSHNDNEDDDIDIDPDEEFIDGIKADLDGLKDLVNDIHEEEDEDSSIDEVAVDDTSIIPDTIIDDNEDLDDDDNMLENFFMEGMDEESTSQLYDTINNGIPHINEEEPDPIEDEIDSEALDASIAEE